MNANPDTRIARRILGITALVMTLALAGVALFASRARAVSFVSDDSYYYLQIARNLATTGMSSFDGVTRTSGYHPLFAFALAGLYALLKPGPDAYVRIMLALNVVLHILTALALYLAGRRLRDRTAGALAALFFLANPYAALWTLSGMEASLNGFALALFLAAAIPPVHGLFHILLASFAGAAAVLARTDNLVVVALLAPLILFANDGPPRRRFGAAVLIAGVAAAALALWMLYCREATGTWQQGSAQIKMLIREYKVSGMSPFGRLAFAFGVFQKFAVKAFVKTPALKYVLLIALVAARDVFRAPRRRVFVAVYLAAVPLVLALAYALKLTRAATWYYVPPVITLTLGAALLARRLLDRDATRARAVAIAVAALVAAEGLVYFGGKLVRGRNTYQRDMLELAEWMSDTLPAGSVVGAWDSGIYSYYSGLRVVNLDGLVNNEIAPMMEANRPLWPEWRARGVDSVASYELWYAGYPDQYWQYWKARGVRYIAGSTRWLRGIPTEWRGARLVVLREPSAQHSSSPKALYEIQWEQD